MNPKNSRQDPALMILVVLLVGFGLVMMYSVGSYNGEIRFGDALYYVKKQFFATALGFLAMYLIGCMDYHRLEKYAVAAYLLSLLLSALVLAAGDSYNGSRRWLSLGPLSFQPSEFAKLAVILFLAEKVSRQKKKRNSFLNLLLVIGMVLPVVALVGTNNLSTAVIILGIAVIVVFVSDKRYIQFVWMGALGIGVVAVFLGMESYRLERLAIWKNPEAYEKGYQTIQGLYAIGSGGLFGRGLGESIQKLGFVPEAQNDMIFSIICEELGYVGAVLLIVAFFILIWRFMVISVHAPDLFGALIAAGAMAHIAIQVILNIAVVTNTIPNTGITLPFISYGGTSVMFLLFEMGLVLNVSSLVK
jgi:cell division protein FtsW